MVIYMPLVVMKVGPSLPFYIYMCVNFSVFYACNWEEHHTHVMRTSAYGFGLTEAQLFCAFVVFLEAFTMGKFS